jgi:hypothetical protein
MEAIVDPVLELQAIGRIHQLVGQEELPVQQVTKFVLADSVEPNLLELYKEIQAGRIQIRNNHVPGKAVEILAHNLLDWVPFGLANG